MTGGASAPRCRPGSVGDGAWLGALHNVGDRVVIDQGHVSDR
jgi:hypothetical protein